MRKSGTLVLEICQCMLVFTSSKNFSQLADANAIKPLVRIIRPENQLQAHELTTCRESRPKQYLQPLVIVILIMSINITLC